MLDGLNKVLRRVENTNHLYTMSSYQRDDSIELIDHESNEESHPQKGVKNKLGRESCRFTQCSDEVRAYRDILLLLRMKQC